jgi:hypothetical protein
VLVDAVDQGFVEVEDEGRGRRLEHPACITPSAAGKPHGATAVGRSAGYRP